MSIEPQSDIVPLSFAQERLWFLDQMAPGNPFYNLQIEIPLACPIDENAWRRTIAEIVLRHEILRTTFHSNHGQPVQRVWPSLDVPVLFVDLRTLPAEQRQDAARHLGAEDGRRPFDLTTGPLLRVTLAQLDDDAFLCVITMHHIVTDGWSMDVLTREIAMLYEAFATGRPSPLSDLPIQYADFAVWQRQQHTAVQLERQLAYWRAQLEGYLDLELPTDFPRPSSPSYRGGFQSTVTGQAVVDALRRLSQKEGATLFMTLLAAFQILLMRYSGSDDVVVGTPIANRTLPETEPLIGFFVNTLVMRGRRVGRPSFREYLATVRETSLGAYSNQDLPFEKLVEELQPRRDLSRNPIFQVMFVLQSSVNRRSSAADSPSYQPAQEEETEAGVSYGTSKFDLTLYLTESDGVLHAIVEYSTDLFGDDTIARLIQHWQTLLQSIAATPDTPITRLPMQPPHERFVLLTEWNRTATPFPHEATIGELFSSQARLRPDAVALSCLGATRTYGELDELSNRLARRLIAAGVKPGDAVGIRLPRGIDMVLAVLAAVKAGGSYLPLDPSYPQARLQTLIADARPRVVLDALPDLPADATPLAPIATADSPAYTLYTSGSTGTPKGVCVSHRNVIRLVRAADYCEFTPDDVFLLLAPLQFDASTLEIWGPLLNGARLEIARDGVLALDELAALIESSGVTTLWLTASLFHRFVDSHLASLWRVRQLLAGGDVLSAAHCQRVIDELPGCTLVNGYGPTETTTFAVCHRMRHGERVPSRVPIGRPIANARLYVMDPEEQLAPLGVPGELYIGGHGVAIGYLHDDALTAARFVQSPFAPAGTVDRLYRTGDQVRYRGDGVLEFLGRHDRQIKLRGFRVELGEIEATMRRHPLVLDACVVVGEADGESQLIGYAVMEGTAQALEVRRYLQRELPDYMVPAAVIPLSQFPMTTSHKIDRRALPAPTTGDWTDAALFVEPRSDTERVIAAVWREVLHVERVGLHDNFFDLGGHSLLLVQVHSRLASVLDTELSIVDLFRFPTVGTLATHLKELPQTAVETSRLDLVDERAARQREVRAQRVQRRRP